MTKQQTKQQIKKKKEAVHKVAIELQNKMKLQSYSLRIKYEDMKYDEEDTAMTVYADIDYLRIVIYINNSTLNENMSAIRAYLCHELTHVIMEPIVLIARGATSPNCMPDFIRRLENSVEHISRLID